MALSLSQLQPRPFTPARVKSSRKFQLRVHATALPADVSRRNVLQVAVALPAVASLIAAGPALAAPKAPSGYAAVADPQDGYQFLYPFGWQEVSVKGLDVVFKDVIEPLESVSVAITPTDRKDVSEYGDVAEVCETLVTKVLSTSNQEVKLVSSNQREFKGRQYYEFEFTSALPKYTRHQLGVVAVADGKFFTLTTGSDQRRWDKMKEKLNTVIRSFQLTV